MAGRLTRLPRLAGTSSRADEYLVASAALPLQLSTRDDGVPQPCSSLGKHDPTSRRPPNTPTSPRPQPNPPPPGHKPTPPPPGPNPLGALASPRPQPAAQGLQDADPIGTARCTGKHVSISLGNLRNFLVALASTSDTLPHPSLACPLQPFWLNHPYRKVHFT